VPGLPMMPGAKNPDTTIIPNRLVDKSPSPLRQGSASPSRNVPSAPGIRLNPVGELSAPNKPGTPTVPGLDLSPKPPAAKPAKTEPAKTEPAQEVSKTEPAKTENPAWMKDKESYARSVGASKPIIGTDVSAYQLSRMSEAEQSRRLKQKFASNAIAREKYNSAIADWESIVWENYLAGKFKSSDVFDKDAFYVLSGKGVFDKSPFKISQMSENKRSEYLDNADNQYRSKPAQEVSKTPSKPEGVAVSEPAKPVVEGIDSLTPADRRNLPKTYMDFDSLESAQKFADEVNQEGGIAIARGKQVEFTSEFYISREIKIRASRNAGNTHLDQIPAYVEDMRGKRIYSVHDPKVKGQVITVDNNGNVYVQWLDKYSQEKEFATPMRIGKKEIMQTSLGKTDLRDYVVDKRNTASESNKSPKSAKSTSRLDAIESDARAKIDEIKQRKKGAGIAFRPEDEPELIAAYAKLGAVKIAKGTIKLNK